MKASLAFAGLMLVATAAVAQIGLPWPGPGGPAGGAATSCTSNLTVSANSGANTTVSTTATGGNFTCQ